VPLLAERHEDVDQPDDRDDVQQPADRVPDQADAEPRRPAAFADDPHAADELSDALTVRHADDDACRDQPPGDRPDEEDLSGAVLVHAHRARDPAGAEPHHEREPGVDEKAAESIAPARHRTARERLLGLRREDRLAGHPWTVRSALRFGLRERLDQLRIGCVLSSHVRLLF
jgi:hypothetical protein